MKNDKLKAARKQSGKTQKQVAKEIGIAEIAYRTYESGRRIPSVSTAIKIAKTLDSTVEELWGGNPA
jgi:DNA-binding XRE family transcriptional regulator